MGSARRDDGLLTFGGHLEVLRWVLVRIVAVAGEIAVVVFCLKDTTWRLLLAPSESGFVTYRWVERVVRCVDPDFSLGTFHVELISTDLSSQFVTHLSTSLYLGLLGASPYILYELFRFVSPALYADERRQSRLIVAVVYALFLAGVLVSYFVLFPVSFRFLGTYSVAERVRNTINLSSYVGTFTTLTLLMGVVFQLPVVAFVLAKVGLVDAPLLARYRRHAFLVILIVAAVITPTADAITLGLVTAPLYLLYEASIWVVGRVRR